MVPRIGGTVLRNDRRTTANSLKWSFIWRTQTAKTGSPNLDLNQMLPENRRHYTYMGSLITPPCTEDVL